MVDNVTNLFCLW